MVYHQSMEPILTRNEAAAFDRSLIENYQLSESDLIDNAARLSYEKTREFLAGRLLFLIGPGNNGADGLSMAELAASDGFDVSVLFLYGKGSPENLRRRERLSSRIHVTEDPHGYDTVIDALFGFGFYGEADERTRDVLSCIGSGSLMISLDIPSASIVDADITVMMTTAKLDAYHPMRRGKAGSLFLVNPGFPEEEIRAYRASAFLLSPSDAGMRRISFTDFKNTKGHLCAIGGSERYQGAIRLSARAAFASGVGLVSVVTKALSLREESPSLMISDGADLSHFDAFLIGPGWDEGDSSLFRRVLETGRNMVIDADGLRHVPGERFGFRAVLTPHIGEYRRLMASLSVPDGLDGSAEELGKALKRLSLETEAVVVLKSSVLWITDGSSLYLYDGVNPSMGIAGSGDVLSGIAAALLAEGESPLRAAIDGVILHQRAGKEAARRYGYYPAETLIEEVGRAR